MPHKAHDPFSRVKKFWYGIARKCDKQDVESDIAALEAFASEAILVEAGVTQQKRRDAKLRGWMAKLCRSAKRCKQSRLQGKNAPKYLMYVKTCYQKLEGQINNH